jgi:hypothetical protein
LEKKKYGVVKKRVKKEVKGEVRHQKMSVGPIGDAN